jgi:hypothetical protein
LYFLRGTPMQMKERYAQILTFWKYSIDRASSSFFLQASNCKLADLHWSFLFSLSRNNCSLVSLSVKFVDLICWFHFYCSLRWNMTSLLIPSTST